MLRVEFPSQCENRILDYRKTLDQYRAAANAEGEEVLFDCTNVCFFRPFGLSLLTILLFDVIRRERCTVSFNRPGNSAVERYLEDQGFYSEFLFSGKSVKGAGRSTGVQLKRLEMYDGSYFDNIARWLDANTSLSPDTVQTVVTVSLAEVVNNVIDHSDSAVGCYVCAQYYPAEERLFFSIVDLGVGILATLREKYPALKNSPEAISLAVQSGVSGKPIGRNAGVGLWLLTAFLKQYGGQLQIVSFEGDWTQNSEGKCVAANLPFQFPGTCINIIINNRTLPK